MKETCGTLHVMVSAMMLHIWERSLYQHSRLSTFIFVFCDKLVRV